MWSIWNALKGGQSEDQKLQQRGRQVVSDIICPLLSQVKVVLPKLGRTQYWAGDGSSQGARCSVKSRK